MMKRNAMMAIVGAVGLLVPYGQAGAAALVMVAALAAPIRGAETPAKANANAEDDTSLEFPWRVPTAVTEQWAYRGPAGGRAGIDLGRALDAGFQLGDPLGRSQPRELLKGLVKPGKFLGLLIRKPPVECCGQEFTNPLVGLSWRPCLANTVRRARAQVGNIGILHKTHAIATGKPNG